MLYCHIALLNFHVQHQIHDADITFTREALPVTSTIPGGILGGAECVKSRSGDIIHDPLQIPGAPFTMFNFAILDWMFILSQML